MLIKYQLKIQLFLFALRSPKINLKIDLHHSHKKRKVSYDYVITNKTVYVLEIKKSILLDK